MGGILDAELFGTAIRQATPLILAALGGCSVSGSASSTSA
jgi:ABC-type uncharacterized transport system permease subunit